MFRLCLWMWLINKSLFKPWYSKIIHAITSYYKSITWYSIFLQYCCNVISFCVHNYAVLKLITLIRTIKIILLMHCHINLLFLAKMFDLCNSAQILFNRAQLCSNTVQKNVQKVVIWTQKCSNAKNWRKPKTVFLVKSIQLTNMHQTINHSPYPT